MAADPQLDHLVALFDTTAIRRALNEAYELGKAEGLLIGERRATERIMQAVAAVGQSTPLAAAPPQHAASASEEGDEDGDEDEKARRAPRGLTRQVVYMILEEEPGLVTAEVQRRAAALDERVSEKTVYNELNREKGKLYRRSMDRWSLIPASSHAPVHVDVEDMLE